MKISNTSAQQIVEEIGKLVRQNISLPKRSGRELDKVISPTTMVSFLPVSWLP